MTPQKIIVDGDFGSDEMQLLAVLLARPVKFEVLGATAVFGNTDHDNVLRNAGSLLRLLNADRAVPRYAGAKSPSGHAMPEGDNAHGDNGIGGISLDESIVPPAHGNAVDFILTQLENNPAYSVSITATGPLTNIAQAWLKSPQTMNRVKQIVVMGGATREMPAKDRPLRQGNITPSAEFNFYMAAQDAQTVMQSGLPLVLFPLDCTQQLSYTPQRQEKLLSLDAPRPTLELISRLMRAAEWIDLEKFGDYNFMHDIHTALYLNDPGAYAGTRGRIDVVMDGLEKGMSRFTSDTNGHILVMNNIISPETLFDTYLESLRTIFS